MPYQLIKQETKFFNVGMFDGNNVSIEFPAGTVFAAAIAGDQDDKEAGHQIVDFSIDSETGVLTVVAKTKVGSVILVTKALLPDGSHIVGCFKIEVTDIQAGAQEHRYLSMTPENFA